MGYYFPTEPAIVLCFIASSTIACHNTALAVYCYIKKKYVWRLSRKNLQ